MDFTQAFSSLGGLLGNATVVTAITTVALTYFVYRRTRSTHSIMSRIWSLFADKKECDDPEIDRFLKSQSALMQFRFTTGIMAETVEQTHKIIQYIKKYRIEPERISACGSYFDISVPALKDEKDLPKRWHILLRVIICALVTCCAILFFIGYASDKMVVRMKESGTWLTLDENQAKPLFGSEGISLNQCTKDHSLLANQTNFTRNDIESICKFNREEIRTYVKSNLSEQRFAFGYAIAVFLYMAIPAFFYAYRGKKARDLNRHIKFLDRNDSPTETRDAPMAASV